MTSIPKLEYQLRTAQITDLTFIARVWTAAFFDDEIIGQIMHPHRNQYPDDVYWFLLRGIRERFWDWRHQFIVVTANDGNVVGAADWRRLGKGGERMELWKADPRECCDALPSSKVHLDVNADHVCVF
jgi:hypothetical protein